MTNYKLFAMGLILLAAAVGVNQAFAQGSVDTTSDHFSEILSAIIIAIISAIATYFKTRSDGQAKANVELSKDNALRQEAILDLATLGYKAFLWNQDTTKTQEEYDVLMSEVKRVAEKYGDKFGVLEQIRAIEAGLSKPA